MLLAGLDYQWFVSINSIAGASQVLDMLMVLITKVGVAVPVIYLLYLWFSGRQGEERFLNRRLALVAVVACVVAFIIDYFLGLAWYRNRPFVDHQVVLLVKHAANSSFPSNHAAGAFAIAISVWASSRRRWAGFFLFLWAIVIGFSRIFVGVHYPTDVMAGFVVALVSTFIAYILRPVIVRYLGRFLGRPHKNS